jgi:hypothetical protein
MDFLSQKSLADFSGAATETARGLILSKAHPPLTRGQLQHSSSGKSNTAGIQAKENRAG